MTTPTATETAAGPSPRRKWPIAVGALLVCVAIVAAVLYLGNDEEADIIEGTRTVELDGVEAGDKDPQPFVSLNTDGKQLPQLHFSNAIMIDHEITVSHGKGLYPVYETTVVTDEKEWLVQPLPGITQADAIDDLAGQVSDVLGDMAQRDMETISVGLGHPLVRPKSHPNEDNPYWFTATFFDRLDGQIVVNIRLQTQPPGTFDYSAADVVPDDRMYLTDALKPLTDIEGLMLYTLTARSPDGSTAAEVRLLHNEVSGGDDPNYARVDCDDYAAAVNATLALLRDLDPSLNEEPDEPIFDALWDGQPAPIMGGYWDGDSLRVSLEGGCADDNTLRFPMQPLNVLVKAAGN